jgi:hypothetical protein
LIRSALNVGLDRSTGLRTFSSITVRPFSRGCAADRAVELRSCEKMGSADQSPHPPSRGCAADRAVELRSCESIGCADQGPHPPSRGYAARRAVRHSLTGPQPPTLPRLRRRPKHSRGSKQTKSRYVIAPFLFSQPVLHQLSQAAARLSLPDLIAPCTRSTAPIARTPVRVVALAFLIGSSLILAACANTQFPESSHRVSNANPTQHSGSASNTDLKGQLDEIKGFARIGNKLMVRGWAADPSKSAPIESLDIVLDDLEVFPASTGDERPDVAKVFGRPDWLLSGWSAEIVLGKILPGEHRIEAVAHGSSGSRVLDGSRYIEVLP